MIFKTPLFHIDSLECPGTTSSEAVSHLVLFASLSSPVISFASFELMNCRVGCKSDALWKCTLFVLSSDVLSFLCHFRLLLTKWGGRSNITSSPTRTFHTCNCHPVCSTRRNHLGAWTGCSYCISMLERPVGAVWSRTLTKQCLFYSVTSLRVVPILLITRCIERACSL